jgi:hypothetical protein
MTMKAIVFTTGTPNTPPFIRSVSAAGIGVARVVQYDVAGVDVAAIAEEHRGQVDFAVYIGALREYHNEHVPLTPVLVRANRAVPMVFFCCDACDPPWWPRIEEYRREGAFSAYLTIDGCRNTPLAKYGLVELTPIDPAYFPEPPVPWNARRHSCGFSGGGGHREQMIKVMEDEAGLSWLTKGSGHVPYELMCAFYAQCSSVINFPRTGSAVTCHVKGRVLEGALAGAVVMDAADSPTSDWFEPGVDYLTYDNVNHAVSLVRELRQGAANGQHYAAMAARMRVKVLERHSPRAFWGRVLAAAGIA